MKKKKKRNAPPPVAPTPSVAPAITPPDRKALLRMLLIHAVLIIGIYFLVVNLGFPYISLVYVIVGTALAIGYLIYNRGFIYRGVREENLSDTLSTEEKQALLLEMRRRDYASKWVLTLLLPMIVAVLLDLLYLFVLPSFGNLLG